MLHACVERFDVMGGRGNILGWDGGSEQGLCKKKFPVTSNLRYMYGVLNVDEIKN
jgi:hypothetical protein